MNEILFSQLSVKLEEAGFYQDHTLPWLAKLHGLLSSDNAPINYFDLLDAMLNMLHPFQGEPERLNGNVTESARLLGLSKPDFVAAALKQPSLFFQKPQKLGWNATESARLLELSRPDFVALALKIPQLFSRKPATLNGKKPYIIEIGEALGWDKDFAALIANAPVALTLGHNHLHVRYILAKLGLKKGSLSTLVTFPSAKAEALIIDHFMTKIALTGKGVRALQVMHSQGLIKHLPYDIQGISRPPRRLRRSAAADCKS